MASPARCCLATTIAALRDRIRRWTRPSTRPVLGYLLDRLRSREELARENALWRKQLEVACRQIARPRFTRADRGMLVLLARLSPSLRKARRRGERDRGGYPFCGSYLQPPLFFSAGQSNKFRDIPAPSDP